MTYNLRPLINNSVIEITDTSGEIGTIACHGNILRYPNLSSWILPNKTTLTGSNEVYNVTRSGSESIFSYISLSINLTSDDVDVSGFTGRYICVMDDAEEEENVLLSVWILLNGVTGMYMYSEL